MLAIQSVFSPFNGSMMYYDDMGGAHLYYVALSDRQERRASEKETDTVLQSYVLSMAMALICALTYLYGARCSTNTVQ